MRVWGCRGCGGVGDGAEMYVQTGQNQALMQLLYYYYIIIHTVGTLAQRGCSELGIERPEDAQSKKKGGKKSPTSNGKRP